MPGWRARRGSARVPIVRVNGAFLGLVVPPGAARITLEYRPLGWSLGLLLAAIGAIALPVLLRLRRDAPASLVG
jgi:uncharacterized membrane protein YfhO